MFFGCCMASGSILPVRTFTGTRPFRTISTGIERRIRDGNG
jgi:hypothetical protein